MLISVVVCTYNRCNLLEQVIKTLTKQILSIDQFEIIVVDNNSKDDTSKFVKCFIKENPETPMRYILETKQGLSHARNCGWKEARGEYIAYIDDDCKAPEQWLEVAKKVIERVKPTVLGGPYYAFYASEKPVWFKDEYGSHTQGNKARPLQDGEYLDGANFFIRKDILELLGGFNPELGMSGNKIAYGEETALVENIRKKIPREIIYYEPKLYVYHLVTPKKMILSWNLWNRFISGLYASHALDMKMRQKSIIKKLLYRILRFIHGILLIGVFFYDVVIGALFRSRSRYPCFQNYFYEHSLKYIEGLGACWG